MELLNKKCVPCEGGTAPLRGDELEKYSAMLLPRWDIVPNGPPGGGGMIRRQFAFNDYLQTMAFVNKVADLAESEGHHPDMHVYWGKVVVELWTHAIGGLSENDFIVAAKINHLAL